MKLTILLVLWCSVALSNGFEPNFERALSLTGDIAKVPFKDVARLVYMTWHKITPFKLFFESMAGKVLFGEKILFQTYLDSFELIEDFIELDVGIEVHKYESIAAKCGQLIGVRVYVENNYQQWTASLEATHDTEITDTQNVIIDAANQIRLLSTKIYNELVQSCSDLYSNRDSSRLKELKGELRAISETCLDNAAGLNKYKPIDAAYPKVKDAISSAYTTWHSMKSVRKIYRLAKFDTVRHLLPYVAILENLKIFYEFVDPDSPIDLDAFHIIALECDQLRRRHKTISHYYNQLHGAKFDEIKIKLAEEANEIIKLIVLIIYQILGQSAELGEQYDQIRSKISISQLTMTTVILNNPVMSNKVKFAQIFTEIVGDVDGMGDQIQLLEDRFAVIQLHIASAYLFTKRALHMIRDYLHYEIEWQPLDEETLQRINLQRTEISKYLLQLKTGIENYQNGGPDQTPIAVASSLIRAGFGKISIEFYKVIRNLLSFLPRLSTLPNFPNAVYWQALDGKFLKHVGYLNELIKNRELLGE